MNWQYEMELDYDIRTFDVMKYEIRLYPKVNKRFVYRLYFENISKGGGQGRKKIGTAVPAVLRKVSVQ